MPTPLPTRLARSRQGLAAAVLVLMSACQAATPTAPAQAPAPAADAASLRAQLLAEIGEARCQRDSDCRSLAIGHKGCGGPEGFVAWSTAQGSASRIASLAARYGQARRQEVERSGLVSDCRALADPGARCGSEQRCVLQPTGAGTSAQ